MVTFNLATLTLMVMTLIIFNVLVWINISSIEYILKRHANFLIKQNKEIEDLKEKVKNCKPWY